MPYTVVGLGLEVLLELGQRAELVVEGLPVMRMLALPIMYFSPEGCFFTDTGMSAEYLKRERRIVARPSALGKEP